jgi:hypothetical protein
MIKTLTSKIGLDVLGVRTRLFLLAFVILFFSISIIGYYGYKNASQAYRTIAMNKAFEGSHDLTMLIETILYKVPEDLQFVTQFYALERYLYWRDLGVDNKANEWYKAVLDSFRSFALSRNFYYKIRFLDAEGNETIKLKHNRLRGDVHFATEQELDDKAKSPFFYEALKLNKGQFYVSEVGLSQENNKIEMPYIPVIRFAMPVVADNDVKYGVAVLNLYAETFLSHIQNFKKDDMRFYLITDAGDYILNPNQETNWSHLANVTDSFKLDFPIIFDKCHKNKNGEFDFDGFVYSYRRIFPHPLDHSRYWIIICQIDEKTIMSNLNQFIFYFVVIFIVSLVISFYVLRFTINGFMRPILLAARQLNSLGKGEIVHETTDYRAKDEIGQILNSTFKLTHNFEALTKQADAIASGDYSQEVIVLSNNDRLGNAINNMTASLKKNEEDNNHRNWLQEGVNQLSQKLSGDLTLQELTERAVSFVARYSESGHGVFYVYNDESKTLELLGTYMFTERDSLSSVYRLGQGAIGQAALEKKPILLKNIPRNEQVITTGVIVAKPLNTFTYPILYEGSLLGVIELASFTLFNGVIQTFLFEAGAVIAGYLYSAIQRDRIKTLLGIAESARSEAEEQSRSLQEANMQLEEQQQQLQMQTEELQNANVQMEEQQQQLHQQTIELQEANVQMEEQQNQLKQQAEELKLKNLELSKSNEIVEKKAKELEKSNQYKSEFLANMSHELRTPLNSIIVLSKLMEKNERNTLKPDDVRRAGVIYQAGQELLRLINDILDLSKIEAGKMEVHIEQINTTDLLTELKDLFEETAKEKKLTFTVQDKLNGTIATDRNKLSQALRNLLANAFKYTKAGTVSLTIQQGDNEKWPLNIIVSDTGIGIPPEKQTLIFEAFQQVDGSVAREYGGTGLGLAITKKFIELLGGRIMLQSAIGKGSAFTVMLPAALSEKAPKPKQTPLLRPIAPTVTVEDDRRNVTQSDTSILVIDDDPLFTQSIIDVNKDMGYKTLVAFNATDGLELVKNYPVSGILLDLGLPDMDGAEVLKIVKSTSELSHIPVYIVSAHDKEQSLIDQGATGYLQKPVSLEEIRDVERLILNARVKQPKVILILESESLKKEIVGDIVKEQDIAVVGVPTITEAHDILKTCPEAVVIVDYETAGQNEASCLDACESLYKLCQKKLSIIIYSSKPIPPDDEARLRRFTDSIVVQTDYAQERLSRGIKHFLKDVPLKKKDKLAFPKKLDKPTDGFSETASLGEQLAITQKLEGLRVMVVDDDARNLFVMTAALEQHGAKVISAISAKKALIKLTQEVVHLILMDIMMPEMSGYEAIQKIRSHETLKSIPIIALTAKALKDDREKCLAAGANDYLSKPVDYDALVNTVAYWGKKRPNKSDVAL